VCDPSTVEIFRSGVAFDVNMALYFESNRTVASVEGLGHRRQQATGICELALN
jgi:hypothetical protein